MALPLIDITLRPGFSLLLAGEGRYTPAETRFVVRELIGPTLPMLFVMNCHEFGMNSETPEAAVQVRFHDYGKDDVNIADLWIVVRFGEEAPARLRRIEIRDAVCKTIIDLIASHGAKVPDNFMIDLFWGPTHACGTVNGTMINW